MIGLFSKFVKNESGATAIEYGLIAGLLSVVIIGALQIAGPLLQQVWTSIGTALQTALPSAPAS